LVGDLVEVADRLLECVALGAVLEGLGEVVVPLLEFVPKLRGDAVGLVDGV
jgi:hypothetical protein